MSLATVHFAPITVVAHRDKANSFRRSSILFRPHVPPTRDFGGAAGYRPRVRSAYYLRVYVHSPGEPERFEYRAGAACTQERGTPFPSWPAVRANSPLGIFRHGRIRQGRTQRGARPSLLSKYPCGPCHGRNALPVGRGDASKGRDQKPALIFSNSCNWRSRCWGSFGVWDRIGASTAESPSWTAGSSLIVSMATVEVWP